MINYFLPDPDDNVNTPKDSGSEGSSEISDLDING